METPVQKGSQEETLRELKRSNELMSQMIANQLNWKLALRQGVLTGLGSVLGATILVSILVSILQPFKRVEILKPSLDRIAAELERRPSSK